MTISLKYVDMHYAGVMQQKASQIIISIQNKIFCIFGYFDTWDSTQQK